MVKTLRNWKNRETTLAIGSDIYRGKIVKEYINLRNLSGWEERRISYYFSTDSGEKIPISAKRVRAENGGLVLKLNAPLTIN